MRIVRRTGLLIYQHPGEDYFSRPATRLDGFFRQRFRLEIVGLLRVTDFELGQQRQRIAVAVVRRFLRPVFGLRKIAEANVGIRQVILRARVARFGLRFVLAAGFHGACGDACHHQQ